MIVLLRCELASGLSGCGLPLTHLRNDREALLFHGGSMFRSDADLQSGCPETEFRFHR